MTKRNFKGNKYNEPFVGIVRSVFDAPQFFKLSPHACKLLFERSEEHTSELQSR